MIKKRILWILLILLFTTLVENVCFAGTLFYKVGLDRSATAITWIDGQCYEVNSGVVWVDGAAYHLGDS